MYVSTIIKEKRKLNCSGERMSSDLNKGLSVDMKFVLILSALFLLEACSISL